ncbi:transcription factor RF2b-like [Quercus robur]|uniref:transcription factor RF2b-like n=1 Tax=Quercus robur TaxID=38942 RepID=UPI0021621537|nr:transcription factor RF2b-like [Quercus robur]
MAITANVVLLYLPINEEEQGKGKMGHCKANTHFDCGGGGGGGGSSTASLDEFGSEDDLFSTYIDVDKLSGADQSGVEGNGNGNGEKSGGGGGGGSKGGHRHSSSFDGSSTTMSSIGVFDEIMDAKKAMPL